LLRGCATAGDCNLIPLKEYDAAYTEEITRELERAAPDAAWPMFAADSVALRDAVRACKGKER
jgi:hypothetical protein